MKATLADIDTLKHIIELERKQILQTLLKEQEDKDHIQKLRIEMEEEEYQKLRKEEELRDHIRRCKQLERNVQDKLDKEIRIREVLQGGIPNSRDYHPHEHELLRDDANDQNYTRAEQ